MLAAKVRKEAAVCFAVGAALAGVVLRARPLPTPPDDAYGDINVCVTPMTLVLDLLLGSGIWGISVWGV